MMALYLVLHTYDPSIAKSENSLGVMKAVLNCFTKETYCITSWMAPGAGKTACIWEAPSEQAIIDVYPKDMPIPIDGIYSAEVVDWAEVKKTMA
jgi:hypothetical protein